MRSRSSIVIPFEYELVIFVTRAILTVRIEIIHVSVAVVVDFIVAGARRALLRRVRVRDGLAATRSAADVRVARCHRTDVPIVGARYGCGDAAIHRIAKRHLTCSGRA
jgi:hypothetical protein